MKNLTPAQDAILVCLWEYYLRNDNLPPQVWVAREMGFASDNAVACHMAQLYCQEYLEVTEGGGGKYKFTEKARDYLTDELLGDKPCMK